MHKLFTGYSQFNCEAETRFRRRTCPGYRVYALFDRSTPDVVRYVGFTSRPLDRRLYNHVQGGKHRRNPPVNQWIADLLSQDRKLGIKLLESTDCPMKGKDAEKLWIKRLALEGHPLLNVIYSVSGVGSPIVCVVL